MRKLTNLKQLHYLLSLYEHQHFGRAAAACFISQSTLSAAITNLEETLAVQLLERDHKTFLFTPLGEEIVKRSRALLEQTDALVDYALTQGKMMQGDFYLGIIPTIAPFILNGLQNRCQERYPDLTLFVREDTTENALKLLSEGKLDMVILALPYPTPDLHTRIVGKDYFQLVLPKTWHHQNLNPEISNLPENSIFLLEKEHCLTGHALQACELKNSKQINHFFATSLHTLIQMVNHQPGITFLPTLAINSGILKGTELIALPLTNKQAYREIGVAWRTTSYKTQMYDKLAQLVQQVVTDTLQHDFVL
ncbi:LysR family transcriptional regulator [Legionella lytica]|uniref:LysR family transcriptional regulator n=1 Tax=Legionella lytica TaxID=96232 RepID=A0ABY4YA93_9GAMM|nr:hydrogen peroxide-inducible genes activator [Legionella lytica]USQ14150.1 LysR family transcriptional regulator [Legionella lytica]